MLLYRVLFKTKTHGKIRKKLRILVSKLIQIPFFYLKDENWKNSIYQLEKTASLYSVAIICILTKDNQC